MKKMEENPPSFPHTNENCISLRHTSYSGGITSYLISYFSLRLFSSPEPEAQGELL